MFAARADVSRATAAIRAMSNSLPDAVGYALERTGALAAGLARQTTLFKDQTGKLRGSIKALPATSTAIRVIAKTPYAKFVEGGTKAHDIMAAAGRVLRFVIGGTVFYRHKVHHPGTAARPFMATTAKEMAPVFSRVMVDAVNASFAAKAHG
jgi:hypothetical protein